MYVDHQGKWIIFDSIDYPGLIDNLIFVYLQNDVISNIYWIKNGQDITNDMIAQILD